MALSLKDFKEFFGYDKLADFARDWKALDDKSRAQLREGIENETFDYEV